MGLNLIINETFLIYNLNFWQLENFQHFDFFNLNNTIKHNFVVFETLIFINLGLIGFLVCYFIPNKMFNNIIIKTILLCFFLVQYFWFIHFINVVNFLNLYPFGLKFKILNFNSFLKELNYGLFFNPLNYNFIIVSVVLTFISCILIILENDNSNNKKAIQNVFLINFFSLNLFLSDNLILFFFFLECTIFPMVFLIGFFGPRNEKNKASIFYFYVSLISGFLIFIGISILSYWFNDLNIYNLFKNFVSFDFNYLFNFYNSFECHVAFLCLFVGLAIKLPIFPFHIWLPEAHGEANTVGSILLAGIYLKMSAYGFLFIVVPIFDPILKIYQNFLQIFFFLSIILSSIVLFKIVDLKKFIAYTSIIHMNFTILLIFVKKIEGLFSMIFSLVTHSYVTSALFFLVGLIYKRTHTRNILNFKLISFFENSSKLSLIFFFFLSINASVPIGPTFLAEIEIIKNFSTINYFNYLFFLLVFIGLSSLAHFFLINKLIGNFDLIFNSINHFKNKKYNYDLNLIEIFILAIFFYFIYKLIFDLLIFLGPKFDNYLNLMTNYCQNSNSFINKNNEYFKLTFNLAQNLLILLNNNNNSNFEIVQVYINLKLNQNLTLLELINFNKELNSFFFLLDLNLLELKIKNLILINDNFVSLNNNEIINFKNYYNFIINETKIK